ncbi:4-(cytidine 5'-diphospho)-2-C-methyl-D-erythritol kinase [Candidatus Kirkpatrickella diaphorinae]|uniref:4-diphosphocytidyl-2-C-methyl-D-erythritol kinase n=1 Tax=Candidatus Kirkpatrickella diaphorinae TaxID=2984322 RepID=A0ABY6GHH8_9PROT|nr:4-(cytidine 5'-diphospho)-2-C-methyl-D-erythritol kinase [Candidatus Kirkpatrickella diaphorinae]UYH50754.1 4-(cytidine 5'-diphospho)-2-C-methyl-D-erythritol kinase [Candidatus Kirkpatrickella diaphorinae]
MKREKAHAKINLYLHITGRRDDGYHLLDSLAIFAASGDALTATTAHSHDTQPGDVTLEIDGPFADGLADCDDNLILRAARRIERFRPSGSASALHLTLTKNLPVASGIGGGSADAAAALRIMAAHWDVDEARIPAIARELGADVPVCLAQRPARMRGIGEDLSAAPAMPPFHLLLVNPGIAVSTPAIFTSWKAHHGRFRREMELPPAWPDLDALISFLNITTNDLQGPAQSYYPIIGQVLTLIASSPGCRMARMSGSGATCFGIFADAEEAAQASQKCRAKGWWAEAGPALT